jgi:signal transduction histidine kinase
VSTAPPATASSLLQPRTRRAIVWLVGPAWGLVILVLRASGNALEGQPRLSLDVTVWVLFRAFLWIPLMAIALRAMEAEPVIEWSRRRFARHLARAFALSAVGGASLYFARTGASRFTGVEAPAVGETISILLRGWLAPDLFIYFLVLAFTSLIAAQRGLREGELQRARLQTSLARTEARLLRSQLDPHFLYNALNAVAALVRPEPARAEHVVCSLSDFLRIASRSANRDQITLAEELRHCDSYLEVQLARFSDRLSIERRIDPTTLRCLVPALALQPLIENVFKHALQASDGPVTMILAAARRENRLELTVADDGPGIGAAPTARSDDEEADGGTGLAHTLARLRLLCGPESTLDLVPRAGGGTLARIRCPWNEAPRRSEAATIERTLR